MQQMSKVMHFLIKYLKITLTLSICPRMNFWGMQNSELLVEQASRSLRNEQFQTSPEFFPAFKGLIILIYTFCFFLPWRETVL